MTHPLLTKHTRRSLLVLLLAVAVFACERNRGSATVTNNAKEPIARATLTVCGQTLELKDLDVGQTATVNYTVTSDSHYAVRVAFRSGRLLQTDVGYVTNGLDFRDETSVTDTEITLVNSKPR